MTCSLTNITFSKEAKFRTKNKINSIYKSIYLDLDIYLYVDLHIYVCVLSHLVVSDSPTPWTVAHQAPLSRGFSRQEYWSGLPCPHPGDLPNPGINPRSSALLLLLLLSHFSRVRLCATP